MNYESFISLPIIGAGFAFLYRKFNSKVDKDLCKVLHKGLDEKIEMIMDNTKYIRDRIDKINNGQ